MSPTECCQLHCHSTSSFFDGLAPVDELVERAAALGQPGIALTDHGNIFGAAKFFKACKKHGIKGVIGMEAYEAVPHAWDPERDKAIMDRKFDEGPRYFHLTMWAQDLQGWQNLCGLHSDSFRLHHKPKNQPLVDRAMLEKRSEGLMIGLGCMASRTNRAMAEQGPDAAYEAAKWYVEVFGDRVYAEVMGNLPEQMALINDQRKLATKLGVPVIATNDVHYVTQEDGRENGPHHALVQARAFKKKEKEEQSDDKSDAGYGKWYGTDEFYLKSRAEMLTTGGINAAEIDRTLEVLDRVTFDFYSIAEPAPPVAPVPVPGEDPEFDQFLAMA